MKKILGIAAVLGTLAYFGKEKAQNYVAIVKQLKFKFLGVSDLSLSGGKLKFKTNIRITNKSAEDFSFASGKNIILRKIKFYLPNGEYVGEATPNLAAIELPAGASVELKDIPTVLPVGNVGGFLENAFQIATNISKMKTKIELEILGKLVKIDNTTA